MPASRLQRGCARPAHGPARKAAALARRRISLAETLDRVLHKGAVVAGDIVISLAGVDLVWIGVHLALGSVDTMRQQGAPRRQKEPRIPVAIPDWPRSERSGAR